MQSLYEELFLGPLGQESADDRKARVAAARDVLAHLRESAEDDQISAADAAYAEALSRAVRLRPRSRRQALRGAA
ncbi:hypothetical protein [Streptomyces sp. NPDC127098]|uniref:hypothetical protein n=1 Tax=Streptomyces sp. NPDC127098 TaxID=3347137 RepID=UPI003669B50B